MDITAVVSTTLSTVAYDSSRKLLQVEFCSKAVYHYFDVPPAVHDALLGARSKGSYFNQAIRGRYLYVRVSSLQAEAPSGAVPPQRERGGGAEWHGR